MLKLTARTHSLYPQQTTKAHPVQPPARSTAFMGLCALSTALSGAVAAEPEPKQKERPLVVATPIGTWEVQCINDEAVEPLRDTCSVSKTVVSLNDDGKFFIVNVRGLSIADRTMEVLSPFTEYAKSGVAIVVDNYQVGLLRYVKCYKNGRACFYKTPLDAGLFQELQGGHVKLEVKMDMNNGYRMEIPMDGLEKALTLMHKNVQALGCEADHHCDGMTK